MQGRHSLEVWYQAAAEAAAGLNKRGDRRGCCRATNSAVRATGTSGGQRRRERAHPVGVPRSCALRALRALDKRVQGVARELVSLNERATRATPRPAAALHGAAAAAPWAVT